MTEHEIAQKAFSNNRERLKAERLAREAAGTSQRRKTSSRRRANNATMAGSRR
jgi:hypothetical protein